MRLLQIAVTAIFCLVASDRSNAEQSTLCNSTSQQAFVSVMYTADTGLPVTHGWYEIAPNKCTDFYRGVKDEFFLLVQNKEGVSLLPPAAQTVSLCVRPDNFADDFRAHYSNGNMNCEADPGIGAPAARSRSTKPQPPEGGACQIRTR